MQAMNPEHPTNLRADLRADLRAILAFYVEAGVDTLSAGQPIDRFVVQAPHPTAAAPDRITPDGPDDPPAAPDDAPQRLLPGRPPLNRPGNGGIPRFGL